MPSTLASGDVGLPRDTSRSPSAHGGPFSARFDGSAYSSLKQRVATLKQEHQRVHRNQRTVEEMESVALMEQRYRYESTIKQFEEKLAVLQEQLKANTDRSLKMRVHFDREKKHLTLQLEQAKRSLDSIHSEHTAQLDALKGTHEQQLTQLSARLEVAQQASAAEQAAQQATHAAALEEVDQWCTGEIEAVRHLAAQQQKKLREEVKHWQDEFERQREQRSKAEETMRDAEGQLSMVQEEVLKLTEALAASQMKCETLQRDMERTATQHAAEMQATQHAAAERLKNEVCSLKATHAQQLELVNVRVKDVIARKDATITALKSELAEVHGQLQQLL